MRTDELLAKIHSQLEELESQIPEAALHLQQLVDRRDELLTTARVIRQTVATPESSDDAPVYPGIDIDFTGATNLHQRLVRIAEAMDGPLDPMDMARCLIQRGQSKEMPKGLRGHITNALKDEPDFPRNDDGTYYYVPKAYDEMPLLTETSST